MSRILLATGGAGIAAPAGNVAWWMHNLVSPGDAELPAARQALPRHHVAAERLLQEARADRPALASRTSRTPPASGRRTSTSSPGSRCSTCSAAPSAAAARRSVPPPPPGSRWRRASCCSTCATTSTSTRTRWSRSASRRSATATAPSVPEVGENIVGPVIEDEVLWACNTCRACEEACPVMIEYVDKIVDMRRHLVQEEARFPAELTRVFKGMETQSNPWGVGADEALRVGRRARHPDRRRQARRRVPLLRRLRRRVRRPQQEDHAGVRAAAARRRASTSPASAQEEPCNGESARRLGNEYLYQSDGADGGRDASTATR